MAYHGKVREGIGPRRDQAHAHARLNNGPFARENCVTENIHRTHKFKKVFSVRWEIIVCRICSSLYLFLCMIKK